MHSIYVATFFFNLSSTVFLLYDNFECSAVLLLSLKSYSKEPALSYVVCLRQWFLMLGNDVSKLITSNNNAGYNFCKFMPCISWIVT
jgi:hypothetical protein